MRGRVGDRVGNKIVRKMRIISMAVVGELQDPRPRHSKLIAQQQHVVRDEPEVLGNKWQTSQFLPQGLEKCGSWTGHPFSGSRCLGPGRDVPRSGETPEVIQTNNVYVSQQRTYSIDAPSVTRRTKRIPVVDRITA